MAMYPNGRYLTLTAGRKFGRGAGLEVHSRNNGERLNRGLGVFAATASVPDGYGIRALIPARRPGSMSALGRVVSLAGAGALLQGGPMSGNGTFGFAATSGALSLVTSLSGAGSISFTGVGALSGVVQLSGTGAITMTGAGSLSMIVPLVGNGAWSLTGAGDMRMRLSMAGSWTPFSALSPEGLAAAVWGTQASTYNEAGTMGAKLNTASSGGVDLDALAAAVWAYTVRSLTSGAAPSAATVAAAVRAELAAELARVDAAITSRIPAGATVPADVRYVNGVLITGTGVDGDTWGPA